MAFALAFSPAHKLSNGLAVSNLYVRIVRAEYRRQTAESQFTVGVISYSLEYYASAETLVSGASPVLDTSLIRHHINYGEGYEVPATDTRPAYTAYKGISPAEANASGIYSLAYAHLATVLAIDFPGITLTHA